MEDREEKNESKEGRKIILDYVIDFLFLQDIFQSKAQKKKLITETLKRKIDFIKVKSGCLTI